MSAPTYCKASPMSSGRTFLNSALGHTGQEMHELAIVVLPLQLRSESRRGREGQLSPGSYTVFLYASTSHTSVSLHRTGHTRQHTCVRR